MGRGGKEMFYLYSKELVVRNQREHLLVQYTCETVMCVATEKLFLPRLSPLQ